MENKVPDLIQYEYETDNLLFKFHLTKYVNHIEISMSDGNKPNLSICTIKQNINSRGDIQPSTVNWFSWGMCNSLTSRDFAEALIIASDIASWFNKGLDHPYVELAKRHGEYFYD